MKTLDELTTRSNISKCTTFYLSDKQASKIQIDLDNDRIWAYYIDKFIEDLMSLFVWKGLPDGITSFILEYMLMANGSFVLYDDGGILKASRYVMVTWDDYFQPVTVRTVNISTDKGLTGKLLYDDEFIYCWNSNTGLPVFNVATTIAERLAKIERTIDYIHRQMRRPTLFSGTQALKSTVDNIMNENDPKTWYVVDKDLNGISGVPVISGDVGKGLDVLMNMRKMYLQEWDTRVGLHTIMNDKSERLTEFEGLSFSEAGNINISGMYQQRIAFRDWARERFPEKCSELDVSYSPFIRVRGEEVPDGYEEKEVYDFVSE